MRAHPLDNRREAAIHPAALPRPFSKGLHAGGYLTNWGYGQTSAPLEKGAAQRAGDGSAAKRLTGFPKS